MRFYENTTEINYSNGEKSDGYELVVYLVHRQVRRLN